MRVMGIHSSPFPEGNTAFVLQAALSEAATVEGVTTEAVSLAGLTIADCRQCDWCMKKQTPDQLCAVEDDAAPLLGRIRDCDVLVLATPVYFGRMTGSMACLIDRTRCFLFGKAGRAALKGKVGVALAVGWRRNYGLEAALQSLHQAFLIHEMLTPSSYAAGVLYGAAVVSGQKNEEGRYWRDRPSVVHDREGMEAVRLLMREAVRTASV